jgi:hypothetical protein
MEYSSDLGPDRKRKARSEAPPPEITRPSSHALPPTTKYEEGDTTHFKTGIPFDEPQTSTGPVNKKTKMKNDSAHINGSPEESDLSDRDWVPEVSRSAQHFKLLTMIERSVAALGSQNQNTNAEEARHSKVKANSNETLSQKSKTMKPKPPPHEKKIPVLVREALQSFDFTKPTSASIADLSTKLNHYTHGGARPIPLGRFQSVDYYIMISENAKLDEQFISVKFTNVKGYSENLVSNRLVLKLGMLVASDHQHKSRWLVFIDETKQLWTLYEDESKEERKFREALHDPYDKSRDKVFGATTEKNAVLIGALGKVPLAEGPSIQPSIFQLSWKMEPTMIKDDRVHQPPAPEQPSVTKPPTAKTPKPNPPIAKNPPVAKELTDIQMAEASGMPFKKCIHLNNIVDLLARDTSFIKIPTYDHILRGNSGYKKPFFHFYNQLRFAKFCEDTDVANKDAGIVIGRPLMEAAWGKLVINAFKIIHLEQERGNELISQATLSQLIECFSQV